MAEEKNRKVVDDLTYLLSCAVDGRTVDGRRAETMDLPALYELAETHLLTGVTAMALESAGIRDEAFTQAKGKAIRKVALMDVERTAVLNCMEEAGIWYVPLKGAVLKDLYPRLGMRQMSDNDILIDPSRVADDAAIMEGLGFALDHTGTTHVVYNKPPVSSFELHYRLFDEDQDHRFSAYYAEVKDRLIPDEGKRFGYRFSDEDFYVYMIAHEYKHYRSEGIGLRALLDTYVFLGKKGDGLNWTYVAEETEKLGIREFEERNRSLSLHLFGGEALSEEENAMLAYVLSSGIYGTLEHRVKNRLEEEGGGAKGKLRYVLDRIFLPMDTVRAAYPLFARIPVLLPFLPLWRLILGLTSHRKKLSAEWKILKDR